jgi:hypothetical protein
MVADGLGIVSALIPSLKPFAVGAKALAFTGNIAKNGGQSLLDQVQARENEMV